MWVLHNVQELTFALDHGTPPENFKFASSPTYYKIAYTYDRQGNVLADKSILTYGTRTMEPDPEIQGSVIYTDLHNTHFRTYAYDEWRRLKSIQERTQFESDALVLAEYQYWLNGQLQKEAIGDALREFDYDNLGRLTELNSALFDDIDNGEVGQPGLNEIPVFAQQLVYDQNSNITNITGLLNTGTPTARTHTFGYVYDEFQRMTSATQQIDYDAAESVPDNQSIDQFTFAYNKNGSIEDLSRTFEHGLSQSYDLEYSDAQHPNRLTRINGAASDQMTYDANGNLVSDDFQRWQDENALGDYTITSIENNYQNLPTHIQLEGPGGEVAHYVYKYDAEGQQYYQKSWLDGTEGPTDVNDEYSFRDAQGRVDLRMEGLDRRLVDRFEIIESDGTLTALRPYLFDYQNWVIPTDPVADLVHNPGILLKQYNNYGSLGLISQTYFDSEDPTDESAYDPIGRTVSLADHLGSTRLQFEFRLPEENGVGTYAERVRYASEYTPFGLEYRSFAQAEKATDGYTGKPINREFSLNAMNFGARFYDPHLGRWWQRDPMETSRMAYSPYNFNRNNPLTLIDPDGMLDAKPDWLDTDHENSQDPSRDSFDPGRNVRIARETVADVSSATIDLVQNGTSATLEDIESGLQMTGDGLAYAASREGLHDASGFYLEHADQVSLYVAGSSLALGPEMVGVARGIGAGKPVARFVHSMTASDGVDFNEMLQVPVDIVTGKIGTAFSRNVPWIGSETNPVTPLLQYGVEQSSGALATRSINHGMEEILEQ